MTFSSNLNQSSLFIGLTSFLNYIISWYTVICQ
nr:MAG TPA: hypothetical protein [Caudoviricetes sp.]